MMPDTLPQMPQEQYNIVSDSPNLQTKQSFFERAINLIKTHKLLSIIIMICIVLLFVFISLSIFYKANSSYTQYNNQQEQELNKKRQADEYQKLIQRQESQSNQQRQQNIETSTIKALGEFNLSFVLVKPTTVQESKLTPLVNLLKQQNNPRYTSLYYLNTFYSNEAKKYQVDNFHLAINIQGIYNLESLEKAGDMAYIWDKDPFGTAKIQDAFDKILIENNINKDKKNLVIFLYFDDSFTNTSTATDRFYEHKKFRSFADKETGKAYINVYDLNDNFAGSTVEIAAHELLHLFNATDKYEESESVKRACSERGRGDLDLKPIVPQQTSDIMCRYIEKENDRFVKGSFSDNNLVINSITAREIGWIK